ALPASTASRDPHSGDPLGARKAVREAALPATSPYASIGRGMKVGKEEMVGLLAAVERYLKVDHEAEFKELDSRVSYMIKTLEKIPGLTADRYLPPIANHVPHLSLTWKENAFKFDADLVARQLLQGNPPIAISRRGERLLHVSVWMMRPGEHQIVTRRLQEVFTGLA